MSAKIAIAALALLTATAGNAVAAVDLKGKTVTIYIAGGVGGGLDLYARTIIPYLSRYLPGEPTIVASNMPGAGGIQGVQYLYNIAPKDGTAIGTTNAGPVSEPLIGAAKVNYDLQKFRWIGSLVKGDTVCAVWHESQVKTLADAKTREVAMSSTGAASAPTRSALLLNALLHTRFKPIAGYDGGSSLLAIERGEVEGTCATLGSLRTTRPDWISGRKLVPIVQVSLNADPEFPEVPRAIDLIKDADEKKMLEFFLAPYEFGNPYMLPPGVADDMLAAYRTAFDKAVKNPDSLADSEKRRMKVQPRDGAEVAQFVDRMFATPKDIVQRTIAATEPAGKVGDKK